MKILTYIKSHLVLSTALGIIIILTAIITGRVASRDSGETTISNIKKVSLVDVSNFRNDVSRVSADGIVESVSQVDLRSQVSGPISSINFSIGDSVYPGQTIASIQNTDIRAQLDQAKAGQSLVEGQIVGSTLSLESAKENAIDSIRKSYVTVNSALNTDIDHFLYYNTEGKPSLASFIMDNGTRNTVRNLFIDLRNSLPDWKEKIDSLSVTSDSSDFKNTIILSQEKMGNMNLLLDAIVNVINEEIRGLPASDTYNTFNTWQQIVTASRVSINTSIQNILNVDLVLSNARINSGSTANAQITSARAVVKNLEAQLSKTIFTAPIAGKIAALPLRIGELAQPGQLIATVVGGGGMQIKAYASGDDFSNIKNGAKAFIQNSIVGTVVNVAPSVNPTNKKVELKVVVDDTANTSLVIGQNVNVLIQANSSTTNTSSGYLFPIQNVKIVPGSAYVYTVDADSKIVAHEITIGKIQGDFIEIVEGISANMKIVTPVYELQEGAEVTVQ